MNFNSRNFIIPKRGKIKNVKTHTKIYKT